MREQVVLANAVCQKLRAAPGPLDAEEHFQADGLPHRAGLLKGLTHGLPMPEAAKLGSVSASFALEKMGTQEHIYTPARFRERYEAVFGALPEGLLP